MTALLFKHPSEYRHNSESTTLTCPEHWYLSECWYESSSKVAVKTPQQNLLIVIVVTFKVAIFSRSLTITVKVLSFLVLPVYDHNSDTVASLPIIGALVSIGVARFPLLVCM